MRQTTEPKDRIYVKRYGFLSFAKNMDTHATKAAKYLSSKYGEKLLHSAKNSTTDEIKTALKKAIQKTAEATGELIGNKSTDKITSVSKKSSKCSQNNEANDESETPTEKYISPEKR